MTAMIDQLRLNIAQCEAETRMNQAVYDDLAQEIMAKLAQRVLEVKIEAQIQPFTDVNATNLKALEEKLDKAEVANLQLIKLK